jgi:uncharacterized protein YcfL
MLRKTFWVVVISLLVSGCASAPPQRQAINVHVMMKPQVVLEKSNSSVLVGDANVGISYSATW